MKCKGLYLNNRPMGRWEFFHNNGKPERTLIITNTDTLLASLFNINGDTLVDKGQGNFLGYVSGIGSNSEELFAKGKIIDGKPDGEWTANLNGENFCIEYYSKGNHLKTILQYRQEPEQINRFYLYTFFPKNYLNILEEFIITDCYEAQKLRSEQFKFDQYKFSSDIESNIEYIVNQDFSSGRTNKYTIGNNFLTISFLINSEGKPYDIKLLSSWGQQFFFTLKNKLYRHVEFPPNTGPYYFQLKMKYTGGSIFSYSINFSKTKPKEY